MAGKTPDQSVLSIRASQERSEEVNGSEEK
jgi:hypothetical protein